MSLKERRKAKRIDARLAVTVLDGPAEATGHTLNISTNGVYFQSPHFIEPLTRVRLSLVVPRTEGKEENIDCDGVVVRVEPENKDSSVDLYKIAVFFTYISKSSQNGLDRYIQMRLSQ